MSSRASAIDASSPRAIACTTQIPDRGGLDGAGEDGTAGRVRSPAAEELVLRAAADDVDLLRISAGRLGRAA